MSRRAGRASEVFAKGGFVRSLFGGRRLSWLNWWVRRRRRRVVKTVPDYVA